MAETVLALSTVPADFDAREMARELINGGVAACVTVLPSARSVYKWQGLVEESAEQQLLMKTTRDRVNALWAALKGLHPYDVPEFVVLPVLEGNPQYLQWIEDSVR